MARPRKHDVVVYCRKGTQFGWMRYWEELRVLRRILNVAVRKKLLPSNPCCGVEFPVAVERRWRSRRVGDAAAPARRRQGVQEVLADEVADEARGAAELNRAANEAVGVLGQVG